ncbi:hypothetical protein KDW_62630 [Dictyobacter vulcani]|uniref:Uncharacterized protein n=1 Tax=Dictyobacter vulcani TaxID=2607529 RepID=A0A5J4L014_9CHLR|nr:hypothetical protein [Dictyobacter vulcani]GER92101.1 hypothetical protein KDW_62630 [Dictyobacter vulcani]
MENKTVEIETTLVTTTYTEVPEIEEVSEGKAELDEILFFSIFMVVGSFVLYGLLAVIEALNRIWNPLSIGCYGILLVMASFIMYVYLMEGEFIKKENAPFHLSITLLGVIVTLVSFSQVCRHVALEFGGFTARQYGYWHWLRFGLAHMLDSALFNMPSNYDWSISEIEPTTFWTRSLVFLFDLCTQVFIVAVVFQRLQVTRKQWAKRRATNRIPYGVFLVSRAKTWILIVTWGLPLIFFLGVIVHDGFSWLGAWIAMSVSLPVFLACWLIWYSLQALTLRGKRNKLLALAVIIASSGLLTMLLPRFIAFLASS